MIGLELGVVDLSLGHRDAHLTREGDLIFDVELDLHELLWVQLLHIEGVLDHCLVGVDDPNEALQVFLIKSPNVLDQFLLLGKSHW